MVDLHVVDLHILRLDAADDIAHIVQGFKFHIDIHISGIFHDVRLHLRQHPDHDGDQQKRQKHALIKSRADGKARTGGRPQASSGGHTLDLLASRHDDGASAQETDAVDDLGAEAAHIGANADLRRQLRPGMGHHIVLIHAQQHRQRRAQTDQHIRPQARCPALPPPLQADHSAEQHRQHQPQHHRRRVQLPHVVQCSDQKVPLLLRGRRPKTKSRGRTGYAPLLPPMHDTGLQKANVCVCAHICPVPLVEYYIYHHSAILSIFFRMCQLFLVVLPGILQILSHSAQNGQSTISVPP